MPPKWIPLQRTSMRKPDLYSSSNKIEADVTGRNKCDFSLLMDKTLRNIMGRGLVGTSLAKLSFASRNSTGGLDGTMYGC